MEKKSGQSGYLKEPGSILSLDGRRFFPVSLNLEGRRVLIVGANESLTTHIRAVIECGANVDVVAEKPAADLKDLALTCSHRMTLLEIIPKDVVGGTLDLTKYFMVFAFSDNYGDNEKITHLARQAGILSTEIAVKQNSDFVVPSWFRRGHIKISVGTDGISGALERALLNRIKAAFVREMDHYALFADFVIEKVNAARVDLDEADLGEVISQLLYSEDVCLALQRNNFDEASQLFEHDLAEAISTIKGKPLETE